MHRKFRHSAMKITLLTAFCLVTLSVSAQNSIPPPAPTNDDLSESFRDRLLHLGLNFTPGIYWLNPNSSNDKANGASLGYGYGLNMEFYFTPNYAFLTGFEITNIGSKYINTNTNPSNFSNIADSVVTHDESLQYLEIPFMLKLKTNSFHRMRYYGVIGLQLGFLLKATDNNNTAITPKGYYSNGAYIPPGAPYSYSDNNANIYSQTDFFRSSFLIGGGAEYSLSGSTALQACITYNNCFTNMNNTSGNSLDIKGIELMLGILF
jgi:Outer membrane protein beta-barrel domain